MRTALPGIYGTIASLGAEWTALPCPGCGRPSQGPYCQPCLCASVLKTAANSRGESPSVRALARYRAADGAPTPLGVSLSRFKYAGSRPDGLALAAVSRIFAPRLPLDLVPNAPVVPVPSDPAALRARGLNPAAWIARAIASAWYRSLEPDLLARRRGVASQVGRSPAERRRQPTGTFTPGRARVIPPAAILVDDVSTTGTTLENAARALKAQGVGRVLTVSLLAVGGPRVAGWDAR